MKLEGTVFRANLTIADTIVEQPDQPDAFVKQLEKCLIRLCRELEIPIPLWLEKNTREFARFHQTIFFEEQFTEKVNFNRFQIRLLK
jgi:hypothetical protein